MTLKPCFFVFFFGLQLLKFRFLRTFLGISQTFFVKFIFGSSFSTMFQFYGPFNTVFGPRGPGISGVSVSQLVSLQNFWRFHDFETLFFLCVFFRTSTYEISSLCFFFNDLLILWVFQYQCFGNKRFWTFFGCPSLCVFGPSPLRLFCVYHRHYLWNFFIDVLFQPCFNVMVHSTVPIPTFPFGTVFGPVVLWFQVCQLVSCSV